MEARMNIKYGDVVLVNRGRKLWSRIGRVMRAGKRVRVRFARDSKERRYSYHSMTLMIRTNVYVGDPR
jgi:hypothetical protein